MPTQHVGAVYRRSSAGQTGQSGNGVGSGPIGWQGYDVITGRIISKDFGNYINNLF